MLGPGWCPPSISALTRQREVDLCEFKATLLYGESSRRAKATKRNSVLWGKNWSQQDGSAGKDACCQP